MPAAPGVDMKADARLIAKAVEFAAEAHAGQFRGDGITPYFNHLAEVAASCAMHEPFDAVLVAACYLHDAIEDTGTDAAILRERFGDEVADLVVDVSDPPDLKGKERRQRQVDHTAGASGRVKLLKIADKTSNVAERAALAAELQTSKSMQRYLDWARAVVDAARGVDGDMEAAFDVQAGRLEAAIAARGKKGKRKG